MELLDTRKKSGNLTGTLISDLVLQILAYVAQTEREFISKGKWKELKQRNAKAKIWQTRKKKCRKNLKKFAGDVNRENSSTRHKKAELLGVSHNDFYRRYRKIIDKTVSKR